MDKQIFVHPARLASRLAARPASRLAARLASLFALLAAGGCTLRGDSGATQGNLDMMAQVIPARRPSPGGRVETRSRLVTVDAALAHLPEGAGDVKKVRETRHPNGYSQVIALDSDAAADSHIDMAIQSGRPLGGVDKAPVWKPGESGIREELNRQFPNMRMQVVADRAYENRFGRFGLAIGRSGENLRCVYAWQYIDDARSAFGNGQRIALEGGDSAPAALRVKLCRADATVDELVAYVQKLQVAIPENYGSFETVAEAPRPVAVAPRPVAVAPRVVAVAPRVVFKWAAVAVAPPAPPSKKAPWRPLAKATQHPAAKPAFVAAPPQGSGPRFMAPVEEAVAARPAAYGAPAGLSPGLPPQAYRGPAPLNVNPYQRMSKLPVDRNPVGSIGADSRPADSRPADSRPADSRPEGAPRVTQLPTNPERKD